MKSLLSVGGFCMAVGLACGAAPLPLPPYRPAHPVSGEIRVWGSPADAAVLQGWADAFRGFHPDSHVVLTLHGPESAMMGVYTGVADLALMARELRIPAETMAFTWAWRYAPTLIEVANAGIGAARPNGAMRVWVNQRNPLTAMTLAQLDAIFGAEHKRGGTPPQTWGDLGANGDWAGRPLHRYGPPVDSVSGLFFRRTVLDDSYKWSPAVKELAGEKEVIAAVASDPDGIGYGAQPAPAGAAVHPLALAAKPDGTPVELTAQSATDRTYPLARTVLVVINRKPDADIEAKTREFLSFVLSAEGQAVVATKGGCLPLTAAQLAAQRENLQ